MKINNVISNMVLAAGFALGMIACTEEAPYSPAEIPGNAEAYFPMDMPEQIDLDENATSFSIEVSRSTSETETTVEVESTDESGLFTIPTTVKFAAGEEVALLTISYDPEELEYDDYKQITIAVGEAFSTPYASSVYTFSAGIPAPWESLGMATFIDRVIFNGRYQVELQRNTLNHTEYRLVDPYTEALKKEGLPTIGTPDKYLKFTIMPKGTEYHGVTTTVANLVGYEDCGTGKNEAQYDEMMVMRHPANFSGYETSDEKWRHNCVKSFATDGTPEVVQLAPIYYLKKAALGSDFADRDDIVLIGFPGVDMSDYSAELEYKGYSKDAEGNSLASVKVSFGTDVASLKVAVANGDDVEAAAGAIRDGSLASTTMTENGTVSLPFEGSGKFSIVCITYAEDGTEGEVTSIEFEVSGGDLPVEKFLGEWILMCYDVTAPPGMGMGSATALITMKSKNQVLITNWGKQGVDDAVTASYDEANDRLVIYNDTQLDPIYSMSGTTYRALVFADYDTKELSTNWYDHMSATIKDNKLVFENASDNSKQWNRFAFCQKNSYTAPYEIVTLHELTWTRRQP